jgi:monoamine oxidase
MDGPVDVAVIGAGAAGIAAARALAGAGRSVRLIEASSRIGGRGWTERIDGMALDLGCGWLHSADRNPWTGIAERAGIAVAKGPTAWRTQWRDLGFSAADRAGADAAWSAWEARLAGDPPASDRAADALPSGGRWNGWLQALSGYINGATLDRVSIADYRAYDDAASDENWRVPSGYGALIAAHCPPVPLHLATPVTAVDESGASLRLDTPSGRIEARHVIVTVSSAVLASGAIRLDPAQDDRLHAAACLPLGLADKLFLALDGPHPFEPETHLIGDPRRADTGSFYIRPLGAPVIEGFFGGAGAEALEREGPAAGFAHAIDALAALAGNDIRRALRPLAATAWGRQDFVRGSYSHALPGHAAARAVLAAPGERVTFAGEATHASDFSTAHGAYESGLRAARAVLGQ